MPRAWKLRSGFCSSGPSGRLIFSATISATACRTASDTLPPLTLATGGGGKSCVRGPKAKWYGTNVGVSAATSALNQASSHGLIASRVGAGL